MIRSDSPAAMRMRVLRLRRRRGIRIVRVRLCAAEIDALISKHYLETKDRADPSAIAEAAEAFISNALNGFE